MSSRVSSTQSARREIGTQASVAKGLAPGAERHLRPVGVVARLQELRPLLGLRRPDEISAAAVGDNVAEAARLFGDALFGAMELDQQHRLFGKREFRVAVESAHRKRVDELDSGDRQAGLDRLDGRRTGGAYVRKRAGPGGDRFGDAREPERDLDDDAERPL